MADTTSTTAAATSAEAQTSRRNEKVGLVVSTKMQKTIVVEIEMRKAHPKYKLVMVNRGTTNSFFTPTIYGIHDACALTGTRWQLK